MKQVQGWWLPDRDTHFEPNLQQDPDTGGWAYQKEPRDYVLRWVKDPEVCIDVGANVGFWTRDFCRHFRTVWAFEPIHDVAECFRKNMNGFDNWHLEQVALSDRENPQAVIYLGANNTGAAAFDPDREHVSDQTEHIAVRRLDSYIDQFDRADLIKADIQGHELAFVRGAEQFLMKFDPVIVLELPRRSHPEREYKQQIVRLLDQLGYRERGHYKKDTVFTR